MRSSTAAPIVVTARFRSGSTLLWHLFRQLSGFVTYYEPCHDSLLAHVDSDTPPQQSHVGVTSYWEEYRPHRVALARRHRTDFGWDRLHLERSDRHGALSRYLEALIDWAAPQRAVLQCNRLDFRLAWLRAQFPTAVVIHLYRDPREEWLSTVAGCPRARWDDPAYATPYEDTIWASALAADLPFLVGPHITHPYQRHYLLWRLSLLMGRRQADISVSLERDLQRAPARTLCDMLQLAGVDEPRPRVSELARLVVRRRRRRSATYRTSRWYRRVEHEADALLASLGLLEGFGRVPLADIKRAYRSSWRPYTRHARDEARHLLHRAVSQLHDDQIAAGRQLRDVGELLAGLATTRSRLVEENARLRAENERLRRHPRFVA